MFEKTYSLLISKKKKKKKKIETTNVLSQRKSFTRT